MAGRDHTTSGPRDRLTLYAAMLAAIAVVFLDGQWEVVSRLTGRAAEGAIPPVVGVVLGAVLARILVLAGPGPALAGLAAGQLLTPALRDAGDVPAFAAAALQGVLVFGLIQTARTWHAGGVRETLDPQRLRDQALTVAVPLALGLLAWWSGAAAWLFDRIGDERSGLLVSLAAMIPALWLAVGLHETGHALIGRRRLGPGVRLRIGQFGRAIRVTVGGVQARIHMLDVVSATGAVELDADRLTVDDMIAVAAAGPAASLLGVVAGLPVLAALSTDGGFVHAFTWSFVVFSAIGVLNLVPLRYRQDRAGGVVATDGHQIVDALAVKWALR